HHIAEIDLKWILCLIVIPAFVWAFLLPLVIAANSPLPNFVGYTWVAKLADSILPRAASPHDYIVGYAWAAMLAGYFCAWVTASTKDFWLFGKNALVWAITTLASAWVLVQGLYLIAKIPQPI